MFSYRFGLKKNETEDRIEEVNPALRGFTHVLESGVTEEPLYGIRLAKSTDMDPAIIAEAEALAKRLEATQKQVIIIINYQF